MSLKYMEIAPMGLFRSVGCGSSTVLRPTLADQHKIGFFSQDRTSQTELTEVVELKEMTEVLQILLKDVSTLRKDINVARHVIRADYESKLKEKSLDLYCRINERVSELEKMHEERAGTIRRAFRQQLSDAIARVGMMYNRSLEDKLAGVRRKQANDQDRQDEQYKDMQATIQRNETVIHMLKLQLAQFQTRKTSLDTAVEEFSQSKSPDSVNEEAEELRDEVNRLNNKMEKMQSMLQDKKDEVIALNRQMENLRQELQDEKFNMEQMLQEQNNLQKNAEADKASSKKMLEKQKAEMERMMQERLRKAKEEMMSSSQQQTMSLQEAERRKMEQLLDEKKKLEEQLQKEKMKNSSKSQGQLDMEKMLKNEKIMKEEIARLKREIDRVQRMWEKKFAILQQSLHALKDESYLRQTMQRQAATLHQASVSYAVDTPVGIMPNPNQVSSSKKPLPDISKGVKPTERDYISYTVSAPSGRGTGLFSVDENQVMSDNDQDLPSDVMPLPDPPAFKSRPRSGTSGRSSSKT